MVWSAAQKLKLIGAILGVVVAGYLVGTSLDWARLPGVDLDPSSTVAELHASRSAAVTVVMFTDYQCAVCRIDHDGIGRVALARPDVQFVFNEWAILGPASRRPARLALAARYQGRYLEARDVLMRVSVSDQNVMASALAEAGVNLTALSQDLRRYGSEIDRELARTSRQAFSLGLAGTPAYLVGHRLVVGRLAENKLERLIARAENTIRE